MISVAPIVALFEAAGLSATDLADVERPHRMIHEFSITGACAVTIPDEVITGVAEKCSDFADVEIRTNGLVELAITPEITSDDLESFRSSVAASPLLELSITIDKTALLSKLVVGPSDRAVVYLFGSAFEQGLASGLGRIEEDLWGGEPGQLVVLVLDADINLSGPCLTVLGGRHLAAPVEIARHPSIDTDALKRVVGLRDRLVGWDEPFAGALSPWNFAAAGEAPDSTQGVLDARLVDLTALFTCDRARRLTTSEAGPIQAEFRGRDHVAFLPMDERRVGDALSDLQRDSLLRIVDWTYQLDALAAQRPDWAADRLPFLQTRIAQILEGRPESERLDGFVTALPTVIEGVEWSWKSFVEGKVAGYLDQVKDLEALVTDSTDKVSSAIGDQIKMLTDTMLAAVGVLIGTFIAATFDSPFNSTVFRIGMLTYAGYVLLFPAAVGMVSAYRQLERSTASFEFRRHSFVELLGEERVDEIVGERLRTAESSFLRTLAFVAAVYVAVTAGAVVAAIVVPDAVVVDRPAADSVGQDE